jgi:hypothetical protein
MIKEMVDDTTCESVIHIVKASTAGPWKAAYSKTNEFGGGNIRSDHHIDGNSALLFYTGPMFHDYEVDREEELANLHLAAAAPELIDALCEMYAFLEIGPKPGVGTTNARYRAYVVRKAESAIAKANGASDLSCKHGRHLRCSSNLGIPCMDTGKHHLPS